MSSLLQHHGTCKNGKVQLLFTLEKEIVEPFKCSQCGTEYENGMQRCIGCESIILFVRDHSLLEGYHDIVKMSDVCESDIYKNEPQQSGGGFKTCWFSNRVRRVDAETVELVKPDGSKTIAPRLYEAYRKPAGTFGCWVVFRWNNDCLLYTSPSPRDRQKSRMPSSA